MGLVQSGTRGEYERCTYRWTFKPCPHCEAENDIAARYCKECKGEIVDPNTRLRGEFRAMKKDPTRQQTDQVVSMSAREGVSQKGNKTVKVEFVTPYRQFTIWFSPESNSRKAQVEWETFQAATMSGAPRTVSYVKDLSSGFYRILAYNRQEDLEPA